MKVLKILFLVTIISCQNIQNKNTSDKDSLVVDSSFIEKIIPSNITFNQGVIFSPLEEKELNFLNYIVAKFAIMRFWSMEELTLQEKIYNSKLFYNNDNNIYIKETNQFDDGKSSKETNKYTYNLQGKVKSIIDIENNRNSIKFSYSGDKITEIEISSIDLPSTLHRGNEFYQFPDNVKITKINQTYSDNLLISKSSESFYLDPKSRAEEIAIKHGSDFSLISKQIETFQRSNTISSSFSYIKICTDESLGRCRIFGFKNEELSFIADFDYVLGELSSFPRELVLITKNDNTYFLKYYWNNLNSSKNGYTLGYEYIIEYSDEYKINRIQTFIYPHNKNKPESVIERYYQYHFFGNNLVEYNIFSRKYNYEIPESEISQIQYKLEENFQKVD